MNQQQWMKARTWLLAGCLVVALLVAGCAAGAPEQTTLVETSDEEASVRQDDATLRILIWQAPTTLNPYLAPGEKEWVASRITYEPLASYDSTGNLVPILAADLPTVGESQMVDGGLAVTWKLKPGVQWSDGEPFTAEDVRFTYEFVTRPDIATTSYDEIAAVEVVDDETLMVHFKHAAAVWSRPFVGIEGVILPEHIFAAYAGEAIHDAEENRMPVGTGPYRVVEFAAEDMLVLESGEVVETKRILYEPNEFYREPEKLSFQQVELYGGGDAVMQAEMMLQEQSSVDYAWNMQVDTAMLEQLEVAEHVQVVAAEGDPLVEHLILNFRDPAAIAETMHTTPEAAPNAPASAADIPPHPIFSDKRVRQALAHAIDRERIAALYGPAGRPTSNILVAPPRYRSPNSFYAFDLERAAALLDAAGWQDHDGDGIRDNDGRDLRIVYQTTINELRQQIQDIIIADVESLGIAVERKLVDASVFFGDDTEHTDSAVRFQADIQQYSNKNESPDPSSYMLGWACSSMPADVSAHAGQNTGRWCNPDYDRLYAQLDSEMDSANRVPLLIAMNDMLIEDVAVIPLVDHTLIAAASATIEGIDRTPWDADTWNIQEWRRVEP
jgi:peptide/nickel transport system substrate-binding protein